MDTVGHGSMVAGLVIYEGDPQHNNPECAVIGVKAVNELTFDGDVMLERINEATRTFADRCRVYNLSFGSRGEEPNKGMSKTLDELSFKRNILFVVAAGNIDPEAILADLGSGDSYPNYILRHGILWPGDCFNVLTVGSFAQESSNFAPQHFPSPFTRSGRMNTSKLALSC